MSIVERKRFPYNNFWVLVLLVKNTSPLSEGGKKILRSNSNSIFLNFCGNYYFWIRGRHIGGPIWRRVHLVCHIVIYPERIPSLQGLNFCVYIYICIYVCVIASQLTYS